MKFLFSSFIMLMSAQAMADLCKSPTKVVKTCTVIENKKSPAPKLRPKEVSLCFLPAEKTLFMVADVGLYDGYGSNIYPMTIDNNDPQMYWIEDKSKRTVIATFSGDKMRVVVMNPDQESRPPPKASGDYICGK